MPIKKTSKTEIVVARALEQMQGERWEHLRGKLETKGLRALIAETTLEETVLIQDKVAELRRDEAPEMLAELEDSSRPRETRPLFARLQKAIWAGVEQATILPWPPLYQEKFDA